MSTESPFVIGIGEVLWDMLPEGRCGGGTAANAIYHLTKLGIRSRLVSAVGTDQNGTDMLEFLGAQGISTEYITRNSLPTGTVDVTLSDGIPQYEIHQPVAWDDIRIPEALLPLLPTVSAVIFGTLSQRAKASACAIRRLLEQLPSACLKVFDINLRQQFFTAETVSASLKAADVLKLNDEEVISVARLLNIPGNDTAVIRQLMNTYGLKTVILTRGGNGSTLYDGASEPLDVPVKPCKVVDTVGCGDAFLAGWLAAVLKGKTASEAMADATERAGLVASQKGAMN